MGLFGSSKPAPPPKPKTLLEMNKEELDAAQKSVKDGLKQSMREIDRQIFGIVLLTCSIEDHLEDCPEEARDGHQEEGGQEYH